MKKHHCSGCERERLVDIQRKNVESWLCMFNDDVFCEHDKVPKSMRMNSFCVGCMHYANFMAGMDAEDEAEMDLIDDIRRNPAKYGYGGS